MSADLAAALKLEQEIERFLGGFALEHAELIRAACRVGPDQNLEEVVATTVYSHTLSALSRRYGREHAARLTATLLDQFERAHAALAAAGEVVH
jgi:hypothetical protein